MPFHAFMQMKRQRLVIVGKLPAFRQIRQDVIVGPQLDQAVKNILIDDIGEIVRL